MLKKWKIVFILVGIFIFHAGLPARIFAGPPDTDGFFSARWGMSVVQVVEVQDRIYPSLPELGNKLFTSSSPPGFYLQSKFTVNPWNCEIEECYTFRFSPDNELYRVDCEFLNYPIPGEVPQLCHALLMVRFEAEETALFKKYGKPLRDEKYNKIWVLPSTTIEIDISEPGMGGIRTFTMEYQRRDNR